MSYLPAANSHAAIYLIGTGATALTGGAAPIKLVNYTTAAGGLHGATHTSPGRITYTEARPTVGVGMLTCGFSFSVSATQVNFYVAANGSPQPAWAAGYYVEDGDEELSFTIIGQAEIVQNTYFELFAASSKNGNLTVHNFAMSLLEIHEHAH